MDFWRRWGFIKAFLVSAVLCLLQYGFSGRDVTDPCKDFYQYACGGFIANNPPRDDFKRLSHFQVAMHNEEVRINQLVLEPEKPDDIKPIIEMKRFFKTCLDAVKNEENEMAVLKRLINEVGGWQLLKPEAWKGEDFDWVKAAAEVRRSTDNSAIFDLGVMSALKLEAILAIKKPSFGLPMEYLTNPHLNHGAILSYANFIHSVARELGSIQAKDELQKAIQDILNFEIRLARSVEESKFIFYQTGLDVISRSGEVGTLLKKFIGLVTNPYGIEIRREERVEVEPWDFLLVLRGEKIETIANYVVWRLVTGLISEATPSLYKIEEEFIADLGESVQDEDRKIVCLRNAKNVFRRALRWKYTEEIVDLGGKNEIANVTSMILETTKTILKESEMDYETKEDLLVKLNKMRILTVEKKETIVNYYEEINLGESYLENQVRTNRFEFGKKIGMLRGDPNWPEIYGRGAGYNKLLNIVHISPGLLHPPFFEMGGLIYKNYAMLGSYIAHEIGQAVQINFAREDFYKKIDFFSADFGRFRTELMVRDNWELTFEEDIVDMFALIVSWRAYQDYVSQHGQEEMELGMEHFTTEQLFFIGYANAYCESITPEALKQIKTGPNSPAEFKVNGPLKYFPEFAKAFNCPVNVNGMNPYSKEKRIEL